MTINRAYESQLQSRSRHFSLSGVEKVGGQPRGDGSRVAAIRMPSLLDDALLRVPRGGHVGAVTPNGGRLRPTGGLVPGGSILGRRLVADAILPLVPRRSLQSRRLMSPRQV